MAIKTFADERTMRIDRGEDVLDAPPATQRRALRLLRALDAAPDLRALRAFPSFVGAALVEGDCVVPIDRGWNLTFRWRYEQAWNVRVEEA